MKSKFEIGINFISSLSSTQAFNQYIDCCSQHFYRANYCFFMELSAFNHKNVFQAMYKSINNYVGSFFITMEFENWFTINKVQKNHGLAVTLMDVASI